MYAIRSYYDKIDMYARYIAEVECGEINISDYLLAQGCVKELK